MSELALVRIPSGKPLPEIRGFDNLRSAVLNGVTAENSKRNYGLALDELSAFSKERQQTISRTLILEFRATMLDAKLSASTVNLKLSAIRKLVHEAKRAGVIGGEEASWGTG
jgi:site-specific recombinase XerD